MNRFGNRIKELRVTQNLLQRQVAVKLEIDTPMLSKIERGERKPKREQVILLAKVLSCDKNELLALWLADRVSDVLDGEYIANDALRIVEEQYQKYAATK